MKATDLRAQENRLLTKADVDVLASLQEHIDNITLSIFSKLTHDETGRYSDDGGIHYNVVGMEKQTQMLTAFNDIRRGFDSLKKL